jgi:diguanylate cyclase
MTATFEQARRSLAFLEQHQLEPSAVNYDLALRYITDAAPDLSREINMQTDGGIRLTRRAAATIADQFLSKNQDEAPDEREKSLAQQTRQLEALTSQAHEMTSGLERDVANALAQAGEWPDAASAFVARLSDAELQLAELRRTVAELQAQGESKEDEQLSKDRDDLTRALSSDEARDVLDGLDSDDRYIVIMFSLDKLEDFNAKFGRQTGDNILKAFSYTLRDCFQDQDLIRMAGNEFIIILKDMALLQARFMAEEALVAMAERRLKLHGTGEWIGIVTASAAIAVNNHEPTTDVLERARSNLLLASNLGGNRVKG